MNGNDRIIDYTYITDNNQNGFGQLESLSDNNGTIYNYVYDFKGRLIENSETVEGITYTNKYTFDVFNIDYHGKIPYVHYE